MLFYAGVAAGQGLPDPANMEFDESSHQLTYSTLLGGDGEDVIRDVVTGEGGSGGGGWHKVFFMGTTTTTTTVPLLTTTPLTSHPGSGAFPLITPSSTAYFQHTHLQNNGEPHDCFVGYLNNDNALEWATFYGGSGNEWGRSIAINSLGASPDNNIYLTGVTSTETPAATSAAANTTGDFPIYATSGAYVQNLFGTGKGDYDAFCAGFTTTGEMIWSTYYGGEMDEWDWKLGYRYNGGIVKCDLYGNILISGTSQKKKTCVLCDMPPTVTGNPPALYTQTQNASWNEPLFAQDAYLCLFRPDRRLRWVTSFGGSSNSPNGPNSTSTSNTADEMLRDMAITNGSSGSRLYLKLTTMSTNTPKPPCPAGAYCVEQTFGGENYDAFIACFDYNAIADPVAMNASGSAGTEYFGMRVFPNPAEHTVSCDFITQRSGNLKVDCCDVLGRTVQSQTIVARAGGNTCHMDVENLAAGMYFIRITDQNTTEYARFIKK